MIHSLRKKIFTIAFIALSFAIILAATVFVYAAEDKGKLANIEGEGPAGRLDIGNYHARLFDSRYQFQVNSPFSADVFYEGDKLVICDHNYQGFSNITKYDYATFTKDSAARILRKVSSYEGLYSTSGYYHCDGSRAESLNDGPIIMVTCADDSADRIHITYWDYAE